MFYSLILVGCTYHKCVQEYACASRKVTSSCASCRFNDPGDAYWSEIFEVKRHIKAPRRMVTHPIRRSCGEQLIEFNVGPAVYDSFLICRRGRKGWKSLSWMWVKMSRAIFMTGMIWHRELIILLFRPNLRITLRREKTQMLSFYYNKEFTSWIFSILIWTYVDVYLANFSLLLWIVVLISVSFIF